MTAPESPDRRTEPDVERILECLAELHNLVRLPRIGWIMAGVKDAESVGDHCFEAAVLAYLLASHVEPKVDIGKVLVMLLFHEVGEARMSDMPRRGSRYLGDAKGDAEAAVTRDVLSGVLGGLTDDIGKIVAEFHERETPEAKLAEAAEELQILFAALMYAKEGVGDMTEYRHDAKGYESYGYDLPASIAHKIGERLDEYLGDKPYWELGYRNSSG
jgi:putative hydrolase of HD superfamily